MPSLAVINKTKGKLVLILLNRDFWDKIGMKGVPPPSPPFPQLSFASFYVKSYVRTSSNMITIGRNR